jgi:hypothetical protein
VWTKRDLRPVPRVAGGYLYPAYAWVVLRAIKVR